MGSSEKSPAVARVCLLLESPLEQGSLGKESINMRKLVEDIEIPFRRWSAVLAKQGLRVKAQLVHLSAKHTTLHCKSA